MSSVILGQIGKEHHEPRRWRFPTKFLWWLGPHDRVAGLRPQALWAQARAAAQQFRRPWNTEAEHDAFAKLAGNENPYGPYESAMEAMNRFMLALKELFPEGNVPTAG